MCRRPGAGDRNGCPLHDPEAVPVPAFSFRPCGRLRMRVAYTSASGGIPGIQACWRSSSSSSSCEPGNGCDRGSDCTVLAGPGVCRHREWWVHGLKGSRSRFGGEWQNEPTERAGLRALVLHSTTSTRATALHRAPSPFSPSFPTHATGEWLDLDQNNKKDRGKNMLLVSWF